MNRLRSSKDLLALRPGCGMLTLMGLMSTDEIQVWRRAFADVPKPSDVTQDVDATAVRLWARYDEVVKQIGGANA